MAGAGKRRGKAQKEATRSEQSGQTAAGPHVIAQPLHMNVPRGSVTDGQSVASHAAQAPHLTGSDADRCSQASHGATQVSRMDGPGGSNAGDDARGRGMSNAPGSRAGSKTRTGSAIRPILFDPAKQLPLNKNVDYPSNVYNLFSQVSSLCLLLGYVG